MRGRRLSRLAAAVALVGLLALPAIASAGVQPYGHNDYGGFRNVLPPGTNGFDNVAQLLQWLAHKTRPPHSSDQLAMYAALTTAAPRITQAQIPRYFKDATFGVRGWDIASTQSPEAGVRILRDKQFGVPHIYGDTRPELMFGIGWATAEDRLFLIDVLRHAGQGDLAQLAGGANVGMDETVWAREPYTPQDLANQVKYPLTNSPYGAQIYRDATNFIAGINAYVRAAKRDPRLMPAEYATLGRPLGPQPFTLKDLVSIGALVGGIFGGGGGAQLQNAVLYEDLERRFGRERYEVAGSPQAATRKPSRWARDRSGFATFLSFVDPADPEAPTTVHGKAFPYQTPPTFGQSAPGTVALPDPGSVRYVDYVVDPPSSGSRVDGSALAHAAAGARGFGPTTGPGANAGQGLLALPRDMSNALVVSAAHSASGHPLAVIGPQVSYSTPQILMEEDIHGPGVDADGASFPGANLYVQLGHGRDYAWSATSSGQNITDTFAVPLCSPDGGRVSIESDYYRLHGRCVKVETLTRSESWRPSPVDRTPAGSITLRSQRTAYGIVIARARIHGRPVLYTNLRSTYMHELDSVAGFYLFNDPSKIRNPKDFFNAAYRIKYTFNWFYADDKRTGYFNSGLNPVRAPRTNPLFPTWSSFAWRGYRGAAHTTPSALVEQQTPASAHPQAIDQSYFTSWNNKQAPGYDNAATGQQFSSVYRSQLLDNNLDHNLASRHGKLKLADVINAMGSAGTQDLRGVEVLPYGLAMLGRVRDLRLASAVSKLRRWVASGAHRINRAAPGASGDYQQSDAVRIIDAWWPRLVRAEFQPVLGAKLLAEIERDFPINDQPGHGISGSHLGSAWDVGFYGIVQKDLRGVLGQRVAGPLNRAYCGGGSRTRCRQALIVSLRQAIARTPDQVYPADGVCAPGDQMCSDSIQFRAIGAISQPPSEWVNRPTFQQADEILGHGLR